MSIERARAKARILEWFDKGRPTKLQRRDFAADIDRFFEALAYRSHWCECMSVLLDDKGTVDFSMSGSGWRAKPSGKGLVVSSVVPGWSFGWRGILKDDLGDFVLSDLGHLARQYVHRSNVAKVLMAVWERSGLVLHPFGSSLNIQRYSDLRPRPSNRVIFEAAEQQYAAEWGVPLRTPKAYRSKWMVRNTLDPAIHQGIFHFLRAQNLVSSDFELEALAAYDCVLQALQHSNWSWALGNPKRDRRDLIRALGMGKRSEDISENIYFLRNQFVAHAGGWRWWDAGEYLEEGLIPDAARLTLRALRKAADIEPGHRRIDPTPDDWSLWLEENFSLIWAAIWSRDPD